MENEVEAEDKFEEAVTVTPEMAEAIGIPKEIIDIANKPHEPLVITDFVPGTSRLIVDTREDEA